MNFLVDLIPTNFVSVDPAVDEHEKAADVPHAMPTSNSGH